MLLNEEFEVKFKDKDSPQQRKMLLDALVDLYNNIHKYHIVKRIDSNDQTSRFMDRFYITQGDIATLLEDYAFTLKVTEWGDILDDRDRPNNLLYILYIPNAKVGNWDYTKSREKLLYIKWNPKNRNIISFHTMSAVQQTNRDKLTERKMKITESNYKEEFKILTKRMGRLNEKLSLQQIRSRDIYSKNAHVNKFYNKRKDLVGTPNKNIKFITSQLNEDGTADFLFQTVVTPYDDPNHVYKELDDAPIADIVNASSMSVNNSGEYMMCIRINDFWDLIEELEVIENNEFDKNTLSAILDLSEDVKYSCNCISFVWSGVSYFVTQEDASLIPNNIYPKKWDKYRAGALCCKHLSGLFRSLSFFIPQMAMSIKKNMKDQFLLD